MKRKVKEKLLKITAKLAYTESETRANSCCHAIYGEEKQPESVKKLRKF